MIGGFLKNYPQNLSSIHIFLIFYKIFEIGLLVFVHPRFENPMNTVPNKPPVVAPEPIQLEEDLSSLLDEQSARLAVRRRRANWVILAFFGLIAASASAWYVCSENNQKIVADLIMDFKSSGKDFKMIAGASGMADQYDEALQEIGTRSSDIDAATKALGVDPTTVAEDGMEADMKEMMGGEGVTVGERNNMLQNSLVGRMAKAKGQTDPKGAAVSGAARTPAAPAATANPALRPNPAATPKRVVTAPAAGSPAPAGRQAARVAPTPRAKEVPVADDAPLVIP
jgi:hypothetical protein